MIPLTFTLWALILAVLCVPFGAAHAKDQRADFAANLFFSICLIGKGNPENPLQYPEFSLSRLRPEAEAMFLYGKPGKAWAANVSFGNFVVSITDDHLCSVQVRRVVASEAEDVFLIAMKHITGKGAMEELPREEKILPYGKVVTRSFVFLPQDQNAFYSTVLSITESPDAPLQAIMSSKPRD